MLSAERCDVTPDAATHFVCFELFGVKPFVSPDSLRGTAVSDKPPRVVLSSVDCKIYFVPVILFVRAVARLTIVVMIGPYTVRGSAPSDRHQPCDRNHLYGGVLH